MNIQYNMKASRGFSLVEIMVGLLIGMIAVVVIFQTLDVAEQRKRSVTGSSELQVSGSITMYMLDRDLRAAGHGFATGAGEGDLNCTVLAFDAARAVPAFNFRLVPVIITDGGAGPDTITVLYGSSNTVVNNKIFASSTPTTKIMQTSKRFGFMRGDKVVVVNDAPTLPNCAMLEITDNTNVDTVTLDHAAAGATYTSDYSGAEVEARFNEDDTFGLLFTQGRMYNLGAGPRLRTWAVSMEGVLGYTDGFSGSATPVEAGSGVLNLKAEYGIDANGDNVLADNEWTKVSPTTPLNWGRVMAVRVAILVRGEQWDREHCNANPTYMSTVNGAVAATNFVMANADGTADTGAVCNPGDDLSAIAPNPNNWRNYRYRVYETIVPLKNMLWGTT